MGCARPAAARPEETPESPRAATRLPARRPLPPRPAPWYGPPGADWHGAPHTRARRWYGPPSPPPPAALTQCLRGGVPRRTGRARSAAAQPFSAAAGPRAVRAERLPRAAENRHFHPSAVATLRALPTREPALVRPASPLGTSLRPVPGRLNRAGPPLERPAPPAALGPVLPHHVRRGLPRQHPPPQRGGGTALPPRPVVRPARPFPRRRSAMPPGSRHGVNGYRNGQKRLSLARRPGTAARASPLTALRCRRQGQQPRREPRPQRGQGCSPQPRAPLVWVGCDRPGTGTGAPLCSCRQKAPAGPLAARPSAQRTTWSSAAPRASSAAQQKPFISQLAG